jgi:hypothetical protein
MGYHIPVYEPLWKRIGRHRKYLVKHLSVCHFNIICKVDMLPQSQIWVISGDDQPHCRLVRWPFALHNETVTSLPRKLPKKCTTLSSCMCMYKFDNTQVHWGMNFIGRRRRNNIYHILSGTRYKIFYFPIMEMWLGICDVKFVKPQFFNSEQPLYYKIQTAFYYLITFMTKTKTSLLENQ